MCFGCSLSLHLVHFARSSRSLEAPVVDIPAGKTSRPPCTCQHPWTPYLTLPYLPHVYKGNEAWVDSKHDGRLAPPGTTTVCRVKPPTSAAVTDIENRKERDVVMTASQ